MFKSIKIRLYPNQTQETKLNSLLGSYRFVYNQCLAYKKQRYESDKLNANLSDLGHYFHQDLRNEYEWLKDHNTKVLKQSIINLEQAYTNFFKQGKGFPKFKSKHDEQKTRFPIDAISRNTFDEKFSKLNLTKTIKGLKFECSERDRNYLYANKEKIKSVTITKKKCGHFYASILIDGNLLKTLPQPINNAIGIDFGIKSLLTLSDGDSIDNPKWIRTNEKQLKKLQRQLSKKQKGSNNRNKAKLKLARKHEKIKNRKQDYLHNITTKIINENQVIVLEDLNVSGMMKNHKLAKAIQELGLYEMRRQLTYKAEWYGRELIFVDRFFPSSKKCSGCSSIKKSLKLSERTYKCESCGIKIDRDVNAAVNILDEGLRLKLKKEKNNVGQRLPEHEIGLNQFQTLVDCSMMENFLLTEDLVTTGLKQENVNLGMGNFV